MNNKKIKTMKEKVSWNDIKEKYMKFHGIDKFHESMAIDVDFGYWLANDVITEAMRWRDPKEELPDVGVDVFVKIERSGDCGVEIIYTSSAIVNDFYHSNADNPFGCEGYFQYGNGGRVKVTVIGWKPIE